MMTPVAITIALLLGSDIGLVRQSAGPAQPSLELSCGMFTPELTEAELIAKFGASHVSRGPVFGFDDGPQDGTILFAQQPNARAEIIWRDPEARRHPAMVIVRKHASRWRTPNGIVVGTDLHSLEKANGRPFRLAGLQIEGGGGGAVVSWAGGRLELPQSANCRIGVYLQPAYDGTEPPDVMRRVASGHDYSSAHPAFQVLSPRVVALAVLFAGVRGAG